MATVQEAIIAPALKEIGILAAGATPESGDADDAFARLNRFLDYLAAMSEAVYQVVRSTATLTASQASFTVGSGGNINIARPVNIERVKYQNTALTPTTEFDLGELLTEKEWSAIAQKSLTGTLPTRAYYSPTHPTGTLYPWPIPTSGNLQWVVYHWQAVAQFAALDTTISLPPAYLEMLTENLAMLLCPMYERQPNPVLVQAAQRSMGLVSRVNSRLRNSELSFDRGALGQAAGGWFNFRTGE